MFANYGTKKMIYEKKPAANGKPLFLLLNDLKTDEYNIQETTASKCYCTDCKKIFDIDTMTVHVYGENELITNGVGTTKQRDISCPECGNVGKYVFICPHEKKNNETKNKNNDRTNDHTSYNSYWCIPEFLKGRYVFAFRDGDENLTRLDDQAIIEETVIFPSGEISTWETELFQTTDLVNCRIMSYKTRISEKGRITAKPAKDLPDPFHYPDITENFSVENCLNVRDYRHASELYKKETGILGRDEIFQEAFDSNRIYTLNVDNTHAKEFTDENLPFEDSSDYSDTYLNIIKWRPSSNRELTEKAIWLAGCLHNEIREITKETARIKSRAVFESLAPRLPHPVYADLVKNGLNLKEHKKGITEDDITPDNALQNIHYHMSVCYPAAIEYAASRAENRVKNYEFSEKRKAIDNPDYVPKTATDNARAKFFREEMRIVVEQLCACDDKILNEVRLAGIDAPTYVFVKDRSGKPYIKKVDHYVSPESDNPSVMQIMQERLSFFVYGLRDGYPVPNDIATRLNKLKDTKTLKEGTQVTKKLQSAFNTNPIATASNIYTLQKWKITDPNHVKSVLDLVNEQSPVVNPGECRIRGERKQIERKYSNFINAGVLSPLRDKTGLRFARLYSETHDKTSVIKDIFDNREAVLTKNREKNWNQFTENVKLYEPIINNKNILLIQTKKDIKIGESDNNNMSTEKKHEEQKKQLRTYIQNQVSDNVIQTAYRDFAPIYGEKTVETINALAREIKHDMQMDKIKQVAEEEGMETAISRYKDDLLAYKDPIQAIKNHQPFSGGKILLATRNGKPLFERSLGEIHDELAEMSRKNIVENEHLELTEEQKDMNEKVKIDLSELAKSQWAENKQAVPKGTTGNFSFTVLEDKYAYIRTASELLNCVAGGNYFNSAKCGDTTIAIMKNENSETCACIELKKQPEDDLGRHWRVDEFQGKSDSVVDRRYYDAFTVWCSKHKIEYESSNDVKKCKEGAREWFFGNGERDFHHMEYDPVLDTVMNNERAEEKRNERIKMATELYGTDVETGLNLPTVPNDLLNF